MVTSSNQQEGENPQETLSREHWESSLIDEENKCWKSALTDEIYLPHDAEIIKKIPLSG